MRDMHRLIVAVVAAVVPAQMALAQIGEKPGAPGSHATSPLMTYGLIIVVAAIVLGAAMKSSKRSHQD